MFPNELSSTLPPDEQVAADGAEGSFSVHLGDLARFEYLFFDTGSDFQSTRITLYFHCSFEERRNARFSNTLALRALLGKFATPTRPPYFSCSEDAFRS